MRTSAFIAIMALSLFMARATSAQTAKSEEIFHKYPGCTAHGTGHLLGDFTVEQRIAQCTAGIDSHEYDGEDLAAFYFNRASLLDLVGHFEEVKRDLRAAYAAWPGVIGAITQPLQFMLSRKQYDLAEQQLEWLEDVLPNEGLLTAYRAKIAFFQQRFTDADKYLDEALKAKPGDADILDMKATLKAARGDSDSAIAIYDELLARYPDRGGFYNARCYVRALAGRELVEKALPDCNKAQVLLPKSAEVLDSRGYVYLRLGRYQEAIADYNAAIALANIELPHTLYGRGLAEQKSGEKLSGEADIAAAEAAEPGIGKIFGTPSMMLE